MQNLEKVIEENRGEALKALGEVVRIRSVAGKPEDTPGGEKAPFGNGVQEALEYTLKKGEEYGFETKNVDNYGGHIDFGSGSETVGIIGHLDVVPEGNGWSFDPYSGDTEDGYILGRGTTDDKGPVYAALMAMKALKDAGFEPKKRIRLILGLDEETNWEGIRHYFNKVDPPDYGFTPDADFPVLNGEKGIMSFEIAGKFRRQLQNGLKLKSLSGGTVVNMVPETAKAVIAADHTIVKNKRIHRRSKTKKIIDRALYERVRKMAEQYRTAKGVSILTKGVGTSMVITAVGKAAHAARPEKGKNAVSILFDFLGHLNFASEDVNDFIRFYNEKIGYNVNGEQIGIGFSDEKSGKLTFNSGLLQSDGEGVSLTVNVRYPVTYTADQVYEGIMPHLDEYGLGIVKMENKEPIYMDPDSDLVRTLMNVYRANTGDTDSEPIVIGGGTYARSCPNIVAYGGLFPGDPDIMHQRDEKLAIERYMQMIGIYAEAIMKLTEMDFSARAEA